MEKDMQLDPVQESAKSADFESVTSPQSPWKRYIGMALCLCSCIIFSFGIYIAKLLYSYHPFTIGLWTFMGMIPFSIPFIIYDWKAIKETIWPWDDLNRRKTFIIVMFRGIAGSFGISLQLYALNYLSIGDCTVITLSTPVFVALVCWLFLREKFSVVILIAVLMTFGGIVIITRPPFLTGGTSYDTDLLIGSCIAMVSMGSMAAAFILLRYARRVNFAFITASFGVTGTLIQVPVCIVTSTLDFPHESWDTFLACSRGTLVFTGLAFLTMAAKFERPTVISLIRTNDVVFTYLWQVLLLGIPVDWFSLGGAAIVVSGVLLVGIFKFIDQKKQ